MKKVRITNYNCRNKLSVFKLLRENTNYEFNHCKLITDEMNPRYYEHFKDKELKHLNIEDLKPAEKCDILVKEDNVQEFIDKMGEYGRNCIILDDNDNTFEEYKYPFE